MRAFHLFALLTAVVSLASTVIADEIIDEAAAMKKIKQLGGTFHDATPMGLSVNLEPIPTLIVPFWAIVIPLTILSAYLLLGKPRSTLPKSEPM
jgi:hypothetical protein